MTTTPPPTPPAGTPPGGSSGLQSPPANDPTGSSTPSSPTSKTITLEQRLENLENAMAHLNLNCQSGASGIGGMVMAGSSSVPTSKSCHAPYAILPGATGGLQALRGPFYKEEGSDDFPQEDNKVSGPRSRAPALPLPIFEGHDFNLYAYDFARWLRPTGISELSDATKMDWLGTAVSNKGGIRAMVDVLARKETSSLKFIHWLPSIFPTSCNETQVRTDLTLLKGLSLTPSYQRLESLLVYFEMLSRNFPKTVRQKVRSV